MTKIRLGGIKIFEGRAHLESVYPPGEHALPEICARLAGNQINLSLVTHIADIGTGYFGTAICTENAHGFSSYFLMKLEPSQGNVVRMQSDMCILSIFPHDQKPAVTGALLQLLGKSDVVPHGLASSPSAMSVLISCANTAQVIDALFDPFEFPTYRSPFDWHAAYQGKEQLLKEIVCSYQEEVIKVYNMAHQLELDLWHLSVPASLVANFGAVLGALGGLDIKLPFLVAQTGPNGNLMCSLCFASACHEQVARVLCEHLPAVKPLRQTGVAAFYLHGPHFGDRYGIASALMNALHNAAIVPLALSCAVSSISFVIASAGLDKALVALSNCFEVPGAKD